VGPGGPGERAGLLPGDRLHGPDRAAGIWQRVRPALAPAAPGVPLPLERERGDDRRPVWLLPESLPAGERRMMAALLAVASGFVLIGGWVWSERRDRLTRPFFLLSLAFAFLLAPVPLFPTPLLGVLHDAMYTAVSLWLPALIVHFFALFPEPRASRSRVWAGVAAAHGVAGLLFVAWLVLFALRLLGHPASAPALVLLQGAAALWFAAGLLSALILFARSYRRAGSSDARRRLRVALAGTVFGLAPIAALIAIHNLAPQAVVPGERWVVPLTLLVPASFAWAIAVHGVFDFRVALRASMAALVLAGLAGAAWLAGEALGARWWPDRGADASGATLAIVALAASLAGPVRALGGRMPSLEAPPPLAAAVGPPLPGHREETAEALLSRACGIVTAALDLDGCTALVGGNGAAVPVASAGRRPPALEAADAVLAAVGDGDALVAADDSRLPPAERLALENAGIPWLLRVDAGETPAVLLLGRRLAGPWLGRREADELARLAAHLAVHLENLALRDAVRTRGALDRELEQAGAFQARLLPRRAPVFPTLDCAAATLSSQAVGGDYYDFVQRSEREFTLAVGDAVGHGVPAALVLAGVQARFRTEAGRGRTPGELLGALNQELAELEQPEKFMAMLCARVDVRHGSLWVANAGLTPPILRRRDGHCEELTGGGILLGVERQAAYRERSVTLGAGDVVVLYTDGLTEARRGEELFGPQRIREVLDRHGHERAGRIVDALIAAVRAFAPRLSDDMTVLVLRQLTDPVPGREEVRPAVSEIWLKPRIALADARG
jgi:serine phosphatase RsbU (regulator of sigma subunit)